MVRLDDAALDRRLGRLLAANRRLRDPDQTPRNRSPMLPVLQRWQNEPGARETHCRPAAEFFLTDLYGDHDVSARDRNVERVMPLMRKILPGPLIGAAADAIELAALSHALDLRLCAELEADGAGRDITVARYAAAYRRVGKPRLRQRQIGLIVDVGRLLDRAVRKPWLWRLLKVSRLPAKAAGLGELQSFLERGFSAFAALGGAQPFLGAIAEREREVSRRLFVDAPDPFGTRS